MIRKGDKTRKNKTSYVEFQCELQYVSGGWNIMGEDRKKTNKQGLKTFHLTFSP